MIDKKSWEYMVAYLNNQGPKSPIASPSDMCEFVEKYFLKGLEIGERRKFYAKNLEPAEFR